jgi:hypothetical protein
MPNPTRLYPAAPAHATAGLAAALTALLAASL